MTFSVGDRVSTAGDDNAKGVVRFVGTVEGTKGEWVGVEWDDAERGRHDGTHDGKRYFSVRAVASTSGSFVRPHKLCERRLDLLDAVRERYGQAPADVVDEAGLRELQKSMNAPLLEFVGFDKVAKKQQEFNRLRVVSVSGYPVSRLGDSADAANLDELLASLQSLDLSDTLIARWTDVAEIASKLRWLRSIDVSRNRMEMPSDGDEPAIANVRSALAKITQLQMGYTGHDWAETVRVAAALPDLEFLSAASNQIGEISPAPPPDAFQRLESLDLSSNPLDDWANVLRFAKLPKLAGLNLSDCGLKDIWFEEGSESTPFPSLVHLNLCNNKVSSWESVSRLHRLKITDLRLRSNPVMETEEGGRCRQLLIVAVPTLLVCNGTSVDRVERRGAEIDYWKLYGQAYLRAKSNPEELEEFSRRHPRYAEFVSKFGDPDDVDVTKPEDQTIKGNLLSLQIECPSKEGFKTVTKKLPPTMQVRKLRPLLQRVVKGVKGHELEISYKCMAFPDLVLPMDDELREIGFYNLQDGDVIYVKF